MAIKIDSPRDAYNFVKEKCSTFATKVATDPTLALKIVGTVLGVIAVVLWLSIILYKHRKARLMLAKPHATSKRKTHGRRQ